VMFGLAEIEQEYRRERQMAGIAVAKRNGVYRGRVKGTTKVTPVRAQTLRTRGLSAPEIGKALGVSPRTVFRYLAEELRRSQGSNYSNSVRMQPTRRVYGT